MADNKSIVAFMPLFGSVRVHAKVFKAFVDMLMEPVEGYQVIPFIHTVGPELSFNRNDAVDRILGVYDPEFIMFCDADNVQPKKVIPRLLSHMESDISAVTSLYYKKQFPHSAVPGNFLPWDENLEKKRKSLQTQNLVGSADEQLLYYHPIRHFDVARSIDVFGLGSVLIRANVFSVIKQPYFRYINGYSAQDHTFGVVSEDLTFCAEFKKAKLKALCDPHVISAHMIEKALVGNEIEENACVN